MGMHLPLHGIIPPVVTPFDEALEIDERSLRRLIGRLLNAGVHGLFLLGSTGEVAFLDEPQRTRVLEIAIEEVAGRVPVLAGVVDTATDRCIRHARAAQRAGVDAVVLTAPFYTRTSQEEVQDHFRYVRDAIDVSVVAYDLPVSVHTKLERDTVVALAREKVIIGLKDSSGDDANLRGVLLELREEPDMSVLTGSELMVDTALLMGAHGAVPGLANVDPDGYVRLYAAVSAHDWRSARSEQERLYRLFDIVAVGVPRTSVGAAGIGGFKTALTLLRVIDCNVTARPQRRYNDHEKSRIEQILDKSGLLI